MYLWPFKWLNITGDYYNSHVLHENFGSKCELNCLNVTNFDLLYLSSEPD